MKDFKRVYIEISNICNLKCDFCPEVHRQSKVMDVDMFRAIIADVAPLTDEVCLHLMGEPLNHPKLADFIAACADQNLPINLTTNGVLLNAARRALLLHPIIRQVNISVHSFEANFGVQDVSGYLSKVFAFTHQAFVERPDMYINYRIWDLQDPATMSDKSAAIRIAIEKEFAFSIDPKVIDLRRRKGYLIKNRLYLNFDSRFEWPSLKNTIRAQEGFCHGLSNHFGIHADGTVVPCCLDKEADIALGNCTKQSVRDILQSERAVQLKAGFAKKTLVEDLCKRCGFIERFDRKQLR